MFPLLEREFFIDILLVRTHLIIVMISWTGLAPWEFEFPFPGSNASTFLEHGCRTVLDFESAEACERVQGQEEAEAHLDFEGGSPDQSASGPHNARLSHTSKAFESRFPRNAVNVARIPNTITFSNAK